MTNNGLTLWFTGLSGAGKSTLAQRMKVELDKIGFTKMEVLDGDVVRENLSKGLGFSREDRDINIRRIGFVASLLTRNGAGAIVAAISPYEETREYVRSRIGDKFVEVYVKCSVEKCIERDTKGLYAKALKGEIKEFTGISDPYEPPSHPEVIVETDKESVGVSTAKILKALGLLGVIGNSTVQLSRQDEEAVVKQLQASGRKLGNIELRTPKRESPTGHELIQPHGGKLVNRLLTGERLSQMLEEVESAISSPSFEKKIVLTPREVSDVEMIATGALSPLEGFMGSDDYQSVINSGRLVNGLAWTIPITLAVGKDFARGLREGDRVLLLGPDGAPLALLNLREKYTYDKIMLAKKVWGTTDPTHPFLRTVFEQGEVLLAGKIDVIRRPKREVDMKYRLTPLQTRQMFVEKGWRSVVAFQTRNPIHRAHEHLTKIALEMVDGLLIHPLVGETKPDDVPVAVRMKCYEALLQNYYPHERTVLAVMPAAMRYGGPKEAIMHAIIRQNYGCTNIIIGRDHAGVGKYYDPLAAHRIFDDYSREELIISPMKFTDAFYCTECGSMASSKTCAHKQASRLTLSGTEVRRMLSEGLIPPDTYTRREVAEVLAEYYKGVREPNLGASPVAQPHLKEVCGAVVTDRRAV